MWVWTESFLLNHNVVLLYHFPPPHCVMLCVVCPQVIQKDLQDCEAHIIALETLVSSSQSNRSQYERLCAEWKQLHTAVKVRKDRVLNGVFFFFFAYKRRHIIKVAPDIFFILTWQCDGLRYSHHPRIRFSDLCCVFQVMFWFYGLQLNCCFVQLH